MKRIEDYFLWKMLVILIRFILILSSASAVIFIVVSVFMRYVLKTSLFGVEEIILLAAMWLYFIGGVYGSYKDNHITADVISTYVNSQKTLRVIKIFVSALCLVVSIVFAIWGTTYIRWCFGVGGSTVGLHIPLIFSRFPLFISFVLMVFYNIYHLVNAVTGREIPRGEIIWL